jgi:hypothetical protein
MIGLLQNCIVYGGANDEIAVTVYQYQNGEVKVQGKRLGAAIEALDNRVNNIDNCLGETIPYFE